jgi:AraC-like DNA-binding protein
VTVVDARGTGHREAIMRGSPEGAGEADAVPTRENVLLYLIERGVVPPDGEATELLRAFAQLQASDLDVARAAGQLSISRRTLSRRFRAAFLPTPKQWLALARALHAHRVILRGGCLKHAAITAGYADQFTMSNAIFRITGLRPRAMRAISWRRFVDIWIERQQDRGTLPRLRPPIR